MPRVATAGETEGVAEIVVDQTEELINAYLSPSLTQTINF